ncbi:MAG: hypothetical protein IJI44_03140 [Erysipelotrichaceae bacterium]|nr:hypothetical protein [Erysipelotrichaceae bacterium]
MSKEKNYDDIIHLPHFVSKNRPHMSEYDRAAQFAPFAALTGYGETIKEAERWTDSFKELSETEKEILDMKLSILLDHVQEMPEISILYFVPDDKKQGGAYIQKMIRVRKIDIQKKAILSMEKEEFEIKMIRDLNGSLFDHYLQLI